MYIYMLNYREYHTNRSDKSFSTIIYLLSMVVANICNLRVTWNVQVLYDC